MQTNLYQLYNRKLNGLTVFRALLEDVLIQRLQKLLRACEESDAETLTCTYGAFTSALFEKNVNFSEALLELVLADENRFLLSAARKEVCPPAICDAAKRELDFFTELAGLSAKAIKTILPEEIAACLIGKQPLWIFIPLTQSTLPMRRKKAMVFLRNITHFPSGITACSL